MKRTRRMTPEEFANKMQQLKNTKGHDEEGFHGDADDLMCELLRSLGYEKGIEIYDSIEKWYA